MQIIYNKLLKGGSAPPKQKQRIHIPQMQKLTTKQKFMAFGASAKKTGNKYIVNPIKSTYKTVKTVVVAPLKYTEQLARVAVSLPGMAGKKVYRKIQKWGLKSNLASSEKKIANYDLKQSSGQPVSRELAANYVKHKAKVELINAKLKLRKARIKNNHTLFINRINPMHSVKSIYKGSKYTNTTMKRDDSVLGALLGRSARTSSNNLTKKHYGEMTDVEKAKFDVLEKKSNLNATLVNKIYSDIIPGEKHTVSEILDEPGLINSYRLALEKKRNDNTMTLDDTKLYNILRRKILLSSQATVEKPQITTQIHATPRTRENIANASQAIIQRKYNKIQENQQIKANATAAAAAAAINKQNQEDAAAQKQLELQQEKEPESDEHRIVSAQHQIQKKLNIGTNLHTSTDVNKVSLIPLNQQAPAAQITKNNRSNEQQQQQNILKYNLDADSPTNKLTYSQEFNKFKTTQYYQQIPTQVPVAQAHEKKGLFSKIKQSSLQKLQNKQKTQELALTNTQNQIIKKTSAHTNKRKELNSKRQKIVNNIDKSKKNLNTDLQKLINRDLAIKPNNKPKVSNYNKYQYFTKLRQGHEEVKLTRKLADMKKKIKQHDKKIVGIPVTANAKTLDAIHHKQQINTLNNNGNPDPDKIQKKIKAEAEAEAEAQNLNQQIHKFNDEPIYLDISESSKEIAAKKKLEKGEDTKILAKGGELKTKPEQPPASRPSKWRKGESASQLTKKNTQLAAPTRTPTTEQLEKQQNAQQKAITSKAIRNAILAEEKKKLDNQKKLNNKKAKAYSQKVKNAENKAVAEKTAAKTQPQPETQKAGTEAQPYKSRWSSTTTQGQQTLSAAAAAKVVAAPVVVPPRRPPPPSEAALASITAEDAKITAEAANVVAAKVVAPTRPPPPSITAEAAKVVAAEEPLAEAAQHTTTTTAPPPSVEASSPSVEASSKPAHNTAAAEAAHNTAAAEAAEAKVVAAEASVEATPENTSTINEQKLKNSIEDTNRVNELQKHENNIAGHTERIKDLNIQQQIIDEMLADKNPQYKATPEINYEIFKKKLNNLQLSPEKKQDYLNDFTNKLRGKHSRSEMSEYIKGELHFHDTRMQSLQEKILSLAPAAQLKAKAEKLAKNTKNINTAKHMAAQALEQVQQNKNTNSLRSPLLQIFRKMKKLNQNLPTKDQLTTTGAISNAAYKAAANANLLTLEEQIRHAEKQSLPINTDTLTKQQNNNTVAGHTAHNAQYAKHVPEAAQHTATTPEVATAATNTKKEANAAKNNASDGVNKNFKGKMLWTSNGTKKTKKIGTRTTFYV